MATSLTLLQLYEHSIRTSLIGLGRLKKDSTGRRGVWGYW